MLGQTLGRNVLLVNSRKSSDRKHCALWKRQIQKLHVFRRCVRSTGRYFVLNPSFTVPSPARTSCQAVGCEPHHQNGRKQHPRPFRDTPIGGGVKRGQTTVVGLVSFGGQLIGVCALGKAILSSRLFCYGCVSTHPYRDQEVHVNVSRSRKCTML